MRRKSELSDWNNAQIMTRFHELMGSKHFALFTIAEEEELCKVTAEMSRRGLLKMGEEVKKVKCR